MANPLYPDSPLTFDQRWALPVEPPQFDTAVRLPDYDAERPAPNPQLSDLQGASASVRLTPVDFNPWELGKFAPNPVVQALSQVASVKDPKTGERYQTWPEKMVRSAVTLPGEVAQGKFAVTPINEGVWSEEDQFKRDHAIQTMIERAQDTSGLMGGGAFAIPKPPGSIGIFGGRNAKTADLVKLAQAEKMATDGVFPDKIWTETGWFQGVDGQWRFEIPDNNAYLSLRGKKLIQSKPDLRLGEAKSVFTHDALFEAYPKLKDVFLHKNTHGDNLGTQYPAVSGQPGGIGLKDQFRPKMQSTLLHEIQHHVQDIEGFAKGGQPEQFKLTAEHRKANEKIIENNAAAIVIRVLADDFGLTIPQAASIAKDRGLTFDNVIVDLAKNKSIADMRAKIAELNAKNALSEWGGYEGYKRLAGEVEARNVQHRETWTPEQRRDVPPNFSQDVQDKLQIIQGVKEQRTEPTINPTGSVGSGPVRKPSTFTRHDLERMNVDELDRMAYGNAAGDVLTLYPKDIKIKFKDDLVNPQHKFDKEGMAWVNSVKFDEPVKVSIDQQGRFNLEDGHHRWFAAQKLGKPLKVEIEKVDGKPIETILNEGVLEKPTLKSDSGTPGSGIAAVNQSIKLSNRQLPSSNTLFVPPAPKLENMIKHSRIETVPLSQVRGTNKMDWKSFEAGKHPEPLMKEYADKPVAVLKNDGEYLIYDGHHRTVKAIESGATEIPMYVIDAKTYAPEVAGRKPTKQKPSKWTASDDELLKELGAVSVNQAKAARAIEQGYTIDAYHGTDNPVDFSSFKRRSNDLGYHFGTPEQAHDRLLFKGKETLPENSRVYPVKLKINNPLRMEDLGMWGSDNLRWGLPKDKFTAEEIKKAINSAGNEAGKTKALRELIQSKGYDGIVYKNTGESVGGEIYRKAILEADKNMQAYLNKGGKRGTEEYNKLHHKWSEVFADYEQHRKTFAEDSYIAFHPEQVRSVFAEFDPKKTKSKNILSVGGLPVTLTPVDFDPFSVDNRPRSE